MLDIHTSTQDRANAFRLEFSPVRIRIALVFQRLDSVAFNLRSLLFLPCSIIAFRFIPNSVVTRPVEAVWNPLIQEPWYRLSYRIRLAIGWLCLVGIIFGSAFGFPLDDVSVR